MELESLDGSSWDVVIAGTGLPQSLLALALSRSGKKVLHVDRNDYYGGEEAALTLVDAEKWAERHAATSDEKSNFSHATISKPTNEAGDKRAPSRSYSLALAPQVVYARSALIPSLVSSRTHTQLDFQAVGSWFLVEAPSDGSTAPCKLIRVPGGREDIFQDDTLDLKAKRSLMKLLRFVTTLEENPDAWTEDKDLPLSTFLQQKFSLPPASHAPILALTLSTSPAEKTTVAHAVPRISRHLSSIGVFGPGFGALAPKYGGLAEISQVACRAGAVGGGVYVLGKGIESVSPAGDDHHVSVTLSGSDKVTTKRLAGQSVDLSTVDAETATVTDTICRSINVVSALPPSIFPRTSEGGVIPVGAVILVPSDTPNRPPVFILAHSSESGECPANQAVLYASVALSAEDGGFDLLTKAVDRFLQSVAQSGDSPSQIERIWSMQYQQQRRARHQTVSSSDNVLILEPLSLDLALQDDILEDVKRVWLRITSTGEDGNASVDEDSFLKFEERDGNGAVDDDDE